MNEATAAPPDEQLPDEQLKAQLRKRFRGESGSQFTLEVELALPAGFTILFGASGAGKTTLLDCIAGLQTPDQGHHCDRELILFKSQSRVNLPPNRRSVALPAAIAGTISAHDGRAECALRLSASH